MRCDLLVEERPRRPHRRHGAVRGFGAQAVGRLAQLLDPRAELTVLGGEAAGRRCSRGIQPVGTVAGERPQGVEDDGDVDRLLHERPPRRRQRTEGGGDHRDDGQPDADEGALTGDPPRTPAGYQRLAQSLQAIDHQDHVRRLRGGGDPPGTHGDTDVGRRQRRRVVDPVAHHDGGAVAPLAPDGIDLLGGTALGDDFVDPDHGTHRLGGVGAVAGHHDHTPDAGPPQRADRAAGIGTHRVVEQDRSRRLAVDGHEDGQRPVEIGPPPRPEAPRRIAAGCHPCGLAQGHRSGAHLALDPAAGHLPDVARALDGEVTVRAARTTAPASTCGDSWSSDAAIRNSSEPDDEPATTTSATDGRPTVNVPVLSNRRTTAPASRSSAAPSFTMTPSRAARESPDTMATGAARISGHGVAVTSTATARTSSPDTNHASAAVTSVATTNTAAYRSASRTNGALDACASDTMRTIPA